jgi:hypothetical protein
LLLEFVKKTYTTNDNETVERLANEFVDKVSEGRFSPAEIQLFSVENRVTFAAETRTVGLLADVSSFVVLSWNMHNPEVVPRED